MLSFPKLRQVLRIEAKSGSLSQASPEMLALFGAPAVATGGTVSPETAMRCPTVFGCVKILSESVAQLPLILYERKSDGTKDRGKKHPLFEILHNQANDWTSAYEFRLNMQEALCLHGHAFALINRDPRGSVSELIQISNGNVTVETDPVTMEPSFKVSDGKGGEKLYDRSRILHLHAMGGRSPITQAREAIGLSLAMEEHAARLFSGGARPTGVLKYPKEIKTPEARARLAEGFRSIYEGKSNLGKTMVLEDGMEFQQMQFNSVDLQFLEMRRHQIAEIARAFRVPLHMLQELERTTHTNAESLGRQFVSLTLMPWLKSWEGAIQRSLFSTDEKKTYYAEFLTDDLARADLSARFEAYAKAVTNGLLSPNEVRAAENRAPYEGGDTFRLPMNTEDAEMTGTDNDG